MDKKKIFRVGVDSSDTYRNNVTLVNEQWRVDAQKLIVLMEIARSLDLIAQRLKGNL